MRHGSMNITLYQYYIRHCLVCVYLMCTTSQKVILLSSGERRTSITSLVSEAPYIPDRYTVFNMVMV